MASENTVHVGDIAKDSITGFQGVVICESKWLHGCRRITIQPEALDKDGKVKDHASFDEPQLVLVRSAKHPTTARTGGPRPEPMRGR